MLLVSGGLELIALLGAVALMAVTLGRGPTLATRKAFVTVAPFIAIAFVALALAPVVNLANVAQAAASPTGLVLGPQDALNVTLGLFGFLVPVAVAMSAQALPMYAGLTAFPRRIVWPLAGTYAGGVALLCAASVPGSGQGWAGAAGALGNVLLAGTLLVFLAVCGGLMRRRGRLPRKVASLAPAPEAAAASYRRQVANQRVAYGPFVALIGSAYAWAAVGSVILLVNGTTALAGVGTPPVANDAARHAFAVGFIALLIAGISARMLPGFSGGAIASPRLVAAALWLGNLAALLRVGSIVVGSLAGTSGFTEALFGLSGPLGLAFAICLAVNLWPAIFTSRPAPMR
jgi:hypothetical protein